MIHIQDAHPGQVGAHNVIVKVHLFLENMSKELLVSVSTDPGYVVNDSNQGNFHIGSSLPFDIWIKLHCLFLLFSFF